MKITLSQTNKWHKVMLYLCCPSPFLLGSFLLFVVKHWWLAQKDTKKLKERLMLQQRVKIIPNRKFTSSENKVKELLYLLQHIFMR